MANVGLSMPKLKYRFRVLFESLSEDELELSKEVMRCKWPKTSFINGEIVYDTLDITFRSDSSNLVSRIIGQQLGKQVSSAVTGENYKFNTLVEIFTDSPNNVVEAMSFKGCFIQSIDYTDWDYTTGDAMEMTVRISADDIAQFNV